MNPNINNNSILSVGFMNIRGQTGLTDAKQRQIEHFLLREKLDVLNIQEININSDSFSNCRQISSSFSIISNNAPSKYGTASIIKTELDLKNITMDTNGRVILFDIADLTIGNMYLPSGTDSLSRSNRENYFSETIPKMLVNRLTTGCIGGDMNCIIDKRDSTHHASNKMSPGLARMVNVFDLHDSFRTLHPLAKTFSHYYQTPQLGTGGTRIDHVYTWGGLQTREIEYKPLAFSDHMAVVVHLVLPNPSSKILSPKARPFFKIKPEVINDSVFQEWLAESMLDWKEVKMRGLETLLWWEIVVKPGIRKLAILRSKQINQEKRGKLNMLMLRQAYISRKIQGGMIDYYRDLLIVHLEIDQWFQAESEKVVLQARCDDIEQSEKIRIFHHDLHQKHVKRSSILKLQTEQGLIVGHKDCAKYLEKKVTDLLCYPATVDQEAREILLREVENVFSDRDNEKLLAAPTEEEVRKRLSRSNLLAAPGTDGIPSLLYNKCWATLGSSLTEVVKCIHRGGAPTQSMQTALMVFGSKPKKLHSLKPGDKRRISLLNSDFKVVTGIESDRFSPTATHSLSSVQLVAGSDRRIHHGINQARDAIYHSSRRKNGCGILDLDFLAGFDWLDMSWVYEVLYKKGVHKEVIDRVRRIYSSSTTITVINNVPGCPLPNKRGSLRQGDVPSMFWFSIGIDPLLVYLEKRLTGIPISSLMVEGPCEENAGQIAPISQTYKIVAYADDVKPSICSMDEFSLVNEGCSLLEKASGVKLHRDPDVGKVKFLPLGKWRGTLRQEDLPFQYIRLSDHLDFLGVELRATYTQTRKANGEQLQQKIKTVVGSWKAGRFMPLILRPHTINCFGLSKMWFKCSSINLREQDITYINGQVKSWLYQDCLEKPCELTLYRNTNDGGLGLLNMKIRSLALLIKSFLETAIDEKYKRSLYHEILFRYHVAGETALPDPGLPPYYSKEFFETIKYYYNQSSVVVSKLSTKQWYKRILNDQMLKSADSGYQLLIPVKAEVRMPGIVWADSWKMLRLKCLSSENMSFLFRLLHGLLPTQDRILRFGLDEANGQCLLCRTESDNIEHALISCPTYNSCGIALLEYARKILPNLTAESALAMNLGQNLSENEEGAITTLLATGWRYIWRERMNKKHTALYKMRAELEMEIFILRKGRYADIGSKMMDVID